MHRVAVAAVAAVVGASAGSIPSAIAQFELCIGQYVVHPLNHDDLQLNTAALSMLVRLYLTLRSFVCHTIDELKTTMWGRGKRPRDACTQLACIFLFSLLQRFVPTRPTNSLSVFRSDNNVSKIATGRQRGEIAARC